MSSHELGYNPRESRMGYDPRASRMGYNPRESRMGRTVFGVYVPGNTAGHTTAEWDPAPAMYDPNYDPYDPYNLTTMYGHNSPYVQPPSFMPPAQIPQPLVSRQVSTFPWGVVAISGGALIIGIGLITALRNR